MSLDTGSLRILIVEDSDADAELVLRSLGQAGYRFEWTRAENEAQFVAALRPDLDVILADFNLPAFSAPRALELLQQHQPDVPLIVVSGSIGEETAVQILHSGAADYLLKDRLARLGPAVRRVVERARLESEKRKAEEALREAEERTRFALEAARVGLWEADLRTGGVRWSAMLQQLHGMPPGSFEGTFGAFLNQVHPDDRHAVKQAIDDSTRLHTESRILYRTVCPDGSTRWIRAIGKTTYDDQGAPVRAAGIGLDVTEQHLLEEQYRQAQKVDAIGQLAGGIAHDFNNLLTAILGYSQLLARALGPDSSLQEDVGEIRYAAEQATSLTGQLLAFSRRQMLAPTVLDLRDTLRGMESMLKRLIGEQIEIVVRTVAEPARVKADPGQIEQVILNLSLNARDAMPDGGSLLLEVAVVELDNSYSRQHLGVEPGVYVMLSATDTGMGMSPETQARIFEPFFTTKHPGKGTGLGLATVQGIVKQSRGHIWVYSELGKGSTFKVYLPRVTQDDTTERSIVADAVDLRGTETVLVVEDEPAVRELVEKVLHGYGYQVLIAATPTDALTMVLQHDGKIHLLLSDVVLPEMSGVALAEQIRALRPEIRVGYMSGYTDNSIVQHKILDQHALFLQKPFVPDVLARKVRAALS